MEYYITKQASKAYFILFTAGYRKIKMVEMDCSAGRNYFRISEAELNALNNGIYYWCVQIEEQNRKERSGLRVLIVIK